MCTKTSAVAHTAADAPSSKVMRAGSAVAEISTGPRDKNANRFSRPPVRWRRGAGGPGGRGRDRGGDTLGPPFPPSPPSPVGGKFPPPPPGGRGRPAGAKRRRGG